MSLLILFNQSARTATITAVGSITTTGIKQALGSAAVTGVGSITAAGHPGDVLQGTAEITAIGLVTVAGASHREATAAVPAVGTAAGAGQSTRSGMASVIGVGVITASSPGIIIPAPPGAVQLIRARGRIGRVFHQIQSPSGDVYHPTIEGWQAEESAPGGMGPASGRISERIYDAHREIFQQGSVWRTFLETDGTCIHSGRLLEPDASGGQVQLADRGVASRADKETERIVYQIRDHKKVARFSGPTEKWSVDTATFHSTGDAGSVVFTRPSTTKTPFDNGPQVIIPLWGGELTRFAATVTLSGAPATRSAELRVLVAKGLLDDDPVDLDQIREVWWGVIGITTGTTEIDVDVDLTLGSNDLPDPNSNGDNRGNPALTGTTYADPEVVVLEVGDDSAVSLAATQAAQSVVWNQIRINGALGADFGKDRFSPSDIVLDLAGRLGIRHDVEPVGGQAVPFELAAGQTYADGLDYAALMSDQRWLILDSGAGAVLEFGPYRKRTWTVTSPWALLDPIPQERFNVVRVPYLLSDGESEDSVLVRADPDPLPVRNYYGRLALSSPAGDRELARTLGEVAVRRLASLRYGGQGRLATVRGADGNTVSAHHIHAGDTIDGRQRGEPDRLRIGRLTRSEDAVFVEFDGDNRALDRLLARRDRRMRAKEAR